MIGTCVWCKKENIRLIRHHYPVPKSKGGKEKVYICKICHKKWHKAHGIKIITNS